MQGLTQCHVLSSLHVACLAYRMIVCGMSSCAVKHSIDHFNVIPSSGIIRIAIDFFILSRRLVVKFILSASCGFGGTIWVSLSW